MSTGNPFVFLKNKKVSNKIVGSIAGALFMLAFLGYGWYRYSDLHTQFLLSLSKIQKLEESVKISNDTLLNMKIENEGLTQKLNDKEEELASLLKENKKVNKKVDELEKLTETDPELLRKYSKVYFLSENYIPKKLADIDQNYSFDKNKPQQILSDVSSFLTDLLEDAADDEITLKIISAYRSFGIQANLKSNYKVLYGAGSANQFSADQGYSEHQLGTAVDFITPSMNETLTTAFENTKEYKWLTDNAYKYGFVLSYPKGNSYYQFEPWHWRFVGVSLARKLHRNKKYFYDLDQREINEYLIRIFD